MPERKEIDCRGMKSPGPVFLIAKAARMYPPATILVIKADDMRVEKDIRGWASTAKATIMRVEKRDAFFIAELKLPG